MRLYLKLAILFTLCIFISAQQHIGGELEEAALENLSSNPSSGNIEGRMYWNTTSDEMRVYDGTAYQSMGTGTGDVSGPGSATDDALTRFDGTTGKLIQGSGVTLDDSDNLQNINKIEVGNGSQGNPSIAFTNQSNTGFYHNPNANGQELAASVNGSRKFFLAQNFFGVDNIAFFEKIQRFDVRTIDGPGSTGFAGSLWTHTGVDSHAVEMHVGNGVVNDKAPMKLINFRPNGSKLLLSNGGIGIDFLLASSPTSWSWRLPPNDGDPGQVLTTDGTGVTTWETPSGGGGGEISTTVALGGGFNAGDIHLTKSGTQVVACLFPSSVSSTAAFHSSASNVIPSAYRPAYQGNYLSGSNVSGFKTAVWTVQTTGTAFVQFHDDTGGTYNVSGSGVQIARTCVSWIGNP